MLCRSLSDPWSSMIWPVAGSNRTGILSVQVKGTPTVASGGPGGCCLPIFSAGIRRSRQWSWTELDELFVSQILVPCEGRLQDMLPVCTTLSKMSSHPSGGPLPNQLMFEVSGLEAG